MSRVRIQLSKTIRGRAVRVLLAATSLMALLASASAQEAVLPSDDPYASSSASRNDPTSPADAPDDGTIKVKGGKAKGDTTPIPSYVPVSPGATRDATANSASGASLFDKADPNDAETAAPASVPTRKLSTAKARDNAAKASLTAASNPKPTPKPVDPKAAEEATAKLETELTTGTVKTPQANAEDFLPLDERPQRETAIEGLKRLPDETPYAAPGIRAGTFILRPSIESGITSTSNADSSVGGKSAVLSETTLRLNALSDWSRHSASLDAYGTFRKSLSGQELKETEAGIDAAVTLDFSDDLRALGTLGYARRPESASSPVAITGAATQPLRQSFTASAGVAKDLGKLRFGVTGRVAHDDYGDADLDDGTVLSQKDRNSTLATITLRGGYEISPAITPFAEVEVGQRRYDEQVDTAGYRRSSDRLGARAGVALDLDQKLVGELSAGWIREGFDDDRLNAISGASVNADLRWSLERGTTLALAAATTVEGATTPGESGSLLHEGTLTLEREIRANVTANAALGAGYRNFSGITDGHDTLLNGQVGATWWLNRYAGLTGRLRYENLRSNLPDRNYDATSVFLGLRLQR